jgi:retron-type reverse transcriptase
VYKNGVHSLVNNYRRISILTCFTKIFEKSVYTRTTQFLNKYDILSECQYGFRGKHSTTHAVLDFVDKVVNALDKSIHSLGIFLDLSKALDTIDHDILIHKLSHYGIRGVALE